MLKYLGKDKNYTVKYALIVNVYIKVYVLPVIFTLCELGLKGADSGIVNQNMDLTEGSLRLVCCLA